MTQEEKMKADRNAEACRARVDLIRWLAEWDEFDVIKLWEFGNVVENHVSNSNTPVEEAIVNMAAAYSHVSSGGRGYLIEMLEQEVEQAKEWFEEAIEITRRMNKLYPQVVAGTAGVK